mmetsp:Transcript_12109/g.48726  ORF Transcript_12109/g.48726 Transcript_12109/m.48726 type:complete len:442 (+) Transcript_12109:35-1360(+)
MSTLQPNRKASERLWQACAQGDVKAVGQSLDEMQGLPDTAFMNSSHLQSPLAAACSAGADEVVELLAARLPEACLYHVGEDGQTPVKIAVAKCSEEAALALIERMTASSLSDSTAPDGDGNYVATEPLLCVAAALGRVSVLSALLAKVPWQDLRRPPAFGASLLGSLAGRQCLPCLQHVCSSLGTTQLGELAQHTSFGLPALPYFLSRATDSRAAVSMLLESLPYSCLTALVDSKRPPLHYTLRSAVVFGGDAANWPLVHAAMLIDHLDEEDLSRTLGSSGTALHIAIAKKQILPIEAMLAKLTSITDVLLTRNKRGETPLHLCGDLRIRASPGDAVLVLSSDRELTADRLSARSDLSFLLEHLATLCPEALLIQDNDGQLPLHRAVSVAPPAVIASLLKAMPREQITQRDNTGKSAETILRAVNPALATSLFNPPVKAAK